MKLFIAGGFLGSGKTTAIWQAAISLQKKGGNIGIITNDQGDQLVDTQFLQQEKIAVEEVTGGCFCCNYQGLHEKIGSFQLNEQADIIFAESVGSCTDLVATVINPLLHFNKGKFDIVLSVFADVRVLYAYLQEDDGLFHGDVNYIYKKQLEEADIIVVNKIDLLNDTQLKLAKALIEKEYSGKTIVYQNSLKAESIKGWVSLLFEHCQHPALRQSLQLDYDKYGEGEAELAWLDEEVGLYTHDENAFATGLLLINNIYAKIVLQKYPIGHLKFLVSDGEQQIKISFTSTPVPVNKQAPNNLKTDRIVILINARVQTSPALLSEIVSDALEELTLSTGCKVIVNKYSSFKPGYPKPTHRM